MRYNKNQKKGAIEMSLNLIILLVIGLTVMGLVIGFVTKLIGDATDKFDTKLQESEQVEKQKVESAPGYFAVGPEILKVKAGQSAKFFVKINNLGTSDLILPLSSEDVSSDGELVITGTNVALKIANTNIGGDCIVKVTSPPLNIAPKDTQVLTVNVESDIDSCDLGNELFLSVEFAVSASSISDTKTISVQII